MVVAKLLTVVIVLFTRVCVSVIAHRIGRWTVGGRLVTRLGAVVSIL